MKTILTRIRRRRPGLLLLASLALLLVSACGPVHADPRWASISLIGETQVAIAFGDRVTVIDALTSQPVELTNAEGTILTGEDGAPVIWEYRLTDQQTRFYSAPEPLGDDRLLLSSYDRRLVEVDRERPDIAVGGAVTVDETQHIIASPLVDDDMIYVGLSDHDLIALSRENKSEELWRFETEHGVWDAPIVVDDILYFTSMDHNLYALDKTTGELIWQTDLEGAMPSQPLYVDGRLYAGSFARKVFAVDAETGEIIASAPTGDWVWSTPVVFGDQLYVADMGGSVYAFNAADLSEVWSQQVAERSIAHTPLVTDEYVIVGSRDQNVYWLDRERGGVVDTREVGGEVLSDILLIEQEGEDASLVLVNTTANQELLVAFTLDTGRRLWAYGR